MKKPTKRPDRIASTMSDAQLARVSGGMTDRGVTYQTDLGDTYATGNKGDNSVVNAD